MDEKELEAVSAAMEELRKGGTLSAETLAKLGGTAQSANKALEGYTKKLLSGASAIGGMARSIEDGGGSFKSMSSAIQGVTNGLGKLVSIVPGFGGALKALTGALGEAAGYVLERMDDITKNYQVLGDASAGAADGFDGLLRQFNQMGNFSLPAFTKAVRANTQGLAALSGSASLGAEELSKVAGSLTTGDTARKFLRLGIGLDAVGEATAQYLADSARFGITQGSTTDELTKKTQNYIVEVDKIARLTGQTREAQQKEAQKSLVDARFRARLATMVANGQKDQADQLRMYVDGMGGPFADAARAYATGIPATKEGAAANLFLNDAIRQNIEAINQGSSATTAIADTMRAAKAGTETFGEQVSYAGDIFGGTFVQASDFAAVYARMIPLLEQGMSLEDATAKAQKEQMEASGKTTQEFTDASLATAGVSKNIQSLGFSLASLAVGPVKKFADSLEYVTGIINKNFGVGGSATTPGGVNRGAPGGPRANTGDARASAEQYLGKKMSDSEFDALIRATHAEAGAGKQASQQEQAMIMASILNRARSDAGGIMGALTAKGQFQAVTGTANNNNQPSKNYLEGPSGDRLKSILGATTQLENISRQQKNFTAANAAAYGPGTNIGYRDQMLAAGGQIIGGSVFQAGSMSGPSSRRQNYMAGLNPAAAGAETRALGQQTSDEQQQNTQNTQLVRQLTELNQTSRDLLAVNKKILQRQS